MGHRKAGLLWVVATLACGEASPTGLTEANARDQWAEQLCKQASECGCEAGQDEQACRTMNADFFAQWENASQQAYLDFDATCMQAWLDRAAESECSATPASEEGACAEESCSFWHGGTPKGEACDLDPAPFATHCAQGLRCFDGECVDPCNVQIPTLGEGDTCSTSNPLAGVCDVGLTCASGTCVVSPDIGDPCAVGSCGPGAYCDDTDTCVARLPDGEACSQPLECETFTCTDDVCSPRVAFACLYLL